MEVEEGIWDMGNLNGWIVAVVIGDPPWVQVNSMVICLQI